MYLEQLQPLKVYLGGDPDDLRMRAVQTMDWRPTAVVLVRCKERYLVSRHRVRRERNGIFEWEIKPDLPKGGVESEDVSVEAAAYRELSEEICLQRRHVLGLKYFGHSLVPYDRHNTGRDGYKEGKLYLFHLAHIEDRGHVAPGEVHDVTHIEWHRDPSLVFVKKGKYTKKGLILSSPEIRGVMKGLRKAA